MIIFPANQPLVIDQNSFLSTIQTLHQQVEARSVEVVLGAWLVTLLTKPIFPLLFLLLFKSKFKMGVLVM